DLAQQGAHDAAHRREVVDDEEAGLGNVAHGGPAGRDCRQRGGSVATRVGAGSGSGASVVSGGLRNSRSSASRFMTMMLMRRFAGLCGSARSNGVLEARPWTSSM